jgi:hypothetical protein
MRSSNKNVSKDVTLVLNFILTTTKHAVTIGLPTVR